MRGRKRECQESGGEAEKGRQSGGGGSRKKEEKLMSNKRERGMTFSLSLLFPCLFPFFSGQEKKGPVIIIIIYIYFSCRLSWMKLSFSYLLSILSFILTHFNWIKKTFLNLKIVKRWRERRRRLIFLSFPWERVSQERGSSYLNWDMNLQWPVGISERVRSLFSRSVTSPCGHCWLRQHCCPNFRAKTQK